MYVSTQEWSVIELGEATYASDQSETLAFKCKSTLHTLSEVQALLHFLHFGMKTFR